MKVKLILTCFSTLICAIPIKAQSVVFEWAKVMGAANYDNSTSIKTDNSGNVYTTGFFNSTVDFDPGTGIFNLTAADDDAFVSKLDASGNFVWVKQFGGFDNQYGDCIYIDLSGNIYTTGWFRGTTDFDPGPGIFNMTSFGMDDAYICKLDPSGNFVWAKQFGASSFDYIFGMETDLVGNVYMTGVFIGTVDFDPGAGIFNLTDSGGDIFVCKLDGTGNFVWAKSMGGTAYEFGDHITVDANQNVYITGNFAGTADFDPGTGVYNLISAGNDDIFVCKLSASGSFLWAKKMGGAQKDQGNHLVLDNDANVYSTGYFRSIVDFDPGAGLYNLTSAGIEDAYVSKLDSIGNFIWANQLGSTSNDQSNAITIDTAGNVYTTGTFLLTCDFDPGAGIFNLTSGGSGDIFIWKLDPSGNLVWAKAMGSSSSDTGYGIHVDDAGNVYSTGSFVDTADFDPDIGVYNVLPPGGGIDIFIHKMQLCTVSYVTTNVNACMTYTVPSGTATYTTSGTYIDTINSAAGCDSIITINLTIGTTGSTGTDVQTACNSFSWLDGNTYTASTTTPTFNFVGGSVNGCDSIVTLNLTILNSATGTDVQTACNSFTWIDGNTYTVSTTVPTFNLAGAAANGCDSLVNLNLTINTVDTNVSVSSATLTANITGAVYQWLDCNAAFSPLTGETAQSFTASDNGSYAVSITQSGCSDTSSCHLVTGLGIEHLFTQGGIIIFPNPAQCEINFISEVDLTGNILVVRNILGEVVSTYKLLGKNNRIFLNGVSGIYFAEMHIAEKEILFKLIKE